MLGKEEARVSIGSRFCVIGVFYRFNISFNALSSLSG